MTPKYSVVIPAYNCEKTVEKAIRSVLAQTYSNLEVIVIDDGSKDNTATILDDVAKEDPRIFVYHAKNKGVAKTRKEGVSLAVGEYILFLDADDLFEASLIKEVDDALDRRRIDLIEFGYMSAGKVHYPLYDCASQTDFFRTVFAHTIINGTEAVVMWNKVYRKELLLKIEDWGGCILEDYLLNMLYYQKINTYLRINKALYNYQVIAGSLSRKFNANTFEEIIRIHNKKLGIIEQNPILKEDKELYFTEAYKWLFHYVEKYALTAFIYKNDLDKKQKKQLLNHIFGFEEIQKAAKIVFGEFKKDKLTRAFYRKAFKMRLKMRLSWLKRKIYG